MNKSQKAAEVKRTERNIKTARNAWHADQSRMNGDHLQALENYLKELEEDR